MAAPGSLCGERERTGVKDDDYERLIERFDSLREADRAAVNDLKKRLEGFPQLFATKTEMLEALQAIHRLERDALTREAYEQQYRALADMVGRLTLEKLDASVFQAFVESYRVEQERNSVSRREIAEAQIRSTETLRSEFIEERATYLTQEYYDQEHRALERQINSVQAWQYKLVGGLVFATFVAPLITALVVYIITHGI